MPTPAVTAVSLRTPGQGGWGGDTNRPLFALLFLVLFLAPGVGRAHGQMGSGTGGAGQAVLTVIPDSIFVRTDNTSPKILENLREKSVGMVSANFVADFSRQRKDFSLKEYPGPETLIAHLPSGEVGAIGFAKPVLRQLVQKMGVDEKVRALPVPLAEIERAMAVRQGNAALPEGRDDALDRFLASKDYARIYAKWDGRGLPYWIPQKFTFLSGGLLLLPLLVLGWWRYRFLVERARGGETLRMSREGLARAQEIAHLGSWDWDLRSNGLEWSFEVYRIFGLDPETFDRRYDAFLSAVHSEDKDGVHQALHDAISHRAPYHNRHRIVRPSGEIRFVEVQAETTYDGDGRPLRMFGTVQDVTGRTLAELRREESETRLRTVMESAADAFITIDDRGIIKSFNPAAEKMFGYASGEVIGKNVGILMPEPDRGRHDAYLEAYQALGKSEVIGAGAKSVTAMRRDGTTFPAERTLSEAVIGQSRIFIGILRDITERVRAEEEIRRSREGLARAQEIAHLGNWDWNIQTNELQWSDEIYRIFGLGPQQFGASYDAFLESVHPEDREVVRKAVADSIATRTPYRIEHRLIRPSGAMRFVEEQGEVSYREDGQPVRMIGTVLDITERKQAEERERTRLRQLEITGRLAKAIGSTLEPEALFRMIVEEIRKAVPCQRCYIGTIDQESLERVTWHESSDVRLAPSIPEEEKRGREWFFKNVYETGKPVRLSGRQDVRQVRESLAKSGVQNLVAVPILREGECIAHLALCRTGFPSFSHEEENLLTAIADHLGPAIRNTQLYREAADRARRIEISSRIARAISSTIEIEEIFKTVEEEIGAFISCDRLIIGTFDHAGRTSAYWHTDERVKLRARTQTEIESAIDWSWENIYKNNTPTRIGDISTHEVAWFRQLLDAGLRSMLFVPILQDGRGVAHIAMYSEQADYFTGEHEKLLVSVAEHLGPLIRNATLFRAARGQAARLTAVSNIAKAVSSVLEPRELFPLIVSEVRKVIPTQYVGVARVCRIHGREKYFALHSETSENIPSLTDSEEEALSLWLLRNVYEPPRVVVAPDLRAIQARWAPRLLDAGIRSFIWCPALHNGKAVAHLFLGRGDLQAFSKEDEDLLISASDHIGLAVKNAELYAEARKRAERLSALNALSHTISLDLDLQTVLDSITKAARDLTLTDQARLYLRKEDSDEFILATITGNSQMGGRSSFRAGDGILGRAVQSERGVVVPDAGQEPLWVSRDLIEKLQFRSAIFHPLTLASQVIGVICTYSTTPDYFHDDDMEFLRALASHAAVAIQNARLHDETNRSLGYHRVVMENTADGIVTIDTGGNILSFNPAAEAIFGCSAEEVVGRTVKNLMPEPWRSLHNGYVDAYLEAGKGKIIGIGPREVEGLRKDGSTFDMDLAVSEALTPDGRVFIGVIRDITERKRVQAEIRRLNEELEAKVAERTSELASSNEALKESIARLQDTQAQLVQSEKMASLGSLVAGIAHEINTPVGVSVTAASLLFDKMNELVAITQKEQIRRSELLDCASVGTESSRILLDNLQKASELIRSFKQVAVDQSSEGRRIFNLTVYLHEILTSLGPALRKTRHRVTVGCTEPVVIFSLPGPISQIVTNFIMNSLTHAFTPEEEGEIVLSAECREGQIHLHYGDNGKGIPEENLKLIFDPFFTTKRGEGGSGLGLHIVYNIVTRTLNGRIACTSTLGKGTQFHVVFPDGRPPGNARLSASGALPEPR